MPARADWDPESYARFSDLRLRPALDLIARIGPLPPGGIVDLGCGSGAAGHELRSRYGGRRVIGLDASRAMLDAAESGGAYDELILDDAARWRAGTPVALIFSNAALHWLPDHTALFAGLASALVPGGVLAVQMPRQFGAPSHRFLLEFAAEMFPDRFDRTGWRSPVHSPVEYHRLLSELGEAQVWETDYIQRLQPAPGSHPVRGFTEPTAMRPYLEVLTPGEARDFIQRYEAALFSAYPVEPDGSVIFPFRRVFFTLRC